jgi:hypothetical protein
MTHHDMTIHLEKVISNRTKIFSFPHRRTRYTQKRAVYSETMPSNYDNTNISLTAFPRTYNTERQCIRFSAFFNYVLLHLLVNVSSAASYK